MPNQLPRRFALGLMASLTMPRLATTAMPRADSGMDELRAEWDVFRSRYLSPDGRVVDTGNQNVSHSEGQGYALLTAVRADDRASFELMLAWTQRTLKRRHDSLHAWRFQPDAANAVADQNNASDGDLCIAWALLEAGRRWGSANHLALGTAITRDVLKHLVRRVGGYTVLLPGSRGFERRDRTVINPSYYVFPALQAMAQAVPDPAWIRLAADGLGLLRAAQFGKWRLPPDWVAVARGDGGLSLPDNYAPRFSYDAVRVPLYLAWGRLAAEPAVAASMVFWGDPVHPYIPAWTDLTTNAIAPYAVSSGMTAVAQLASAQRSAMARPPHGLPSIKGAADYYSAALIMLVRLAWADMIPA